MACLFFLGMGYTGLLLNPALPEGGTYTVEGTAAGNFMLREDDTAAGYLADVRLTDESGQISSQRKIYWTYTPDEEDPFLPLEGDRVCFTGRVYAPSGQTNPYGFDFRLYLLEKGVSVGVTGIRDEEIISHPGRGIASFFYHLRQSLASRVEALFGEQSALPEALLLGIRDNLPEETQSAFESAGLAHLLAVSGLHVGLLVEALYLIVLRFLQPKHRFLVSALFLACYCALLDFAAPVVRASVLILCSELRRIYRRAADPVTTLAAAFMLILLVSPLSLFTASFQLSFSAVLAISLFMPLLQRKFHLTGKSPLAEGLLITVPGTLGTLLPTVQWFHRVSLLGPVINPLACLLFSFLLPVYAVVLIVGCIWLPLGQLLSFPVNFITQGVQAVIDFLGRLPFASVRIPTVPTLFVLALVLLGLSLTRLTAFQRRTKCIIVCAAFAAAALFSIFTHENRVQYIQLAMGQADAAVITNGSRTIVIDTGETGGDLCSYLLATGRNPDMLVLTHLHSDHCGGVRRMIENGLTIGTLCIPTDAETTVLDEGGMDLLALIDEYDLPVQWLSAGDTLSTPRVGLTVLWPYEGTVVPGQDPNLYSMVLLCNLDGVTLLNAGDIDGLFENYAARPADILKIAHHGSNSSTDDAFLNTVSPSLALITANGFSTVLPGEKTLTRLSEHQLPYYNTGLTGAVSIICDSGTAHISTFLPASETQTSSVLPDTAE